MMKSILADIVRQPKIVFEKNHPNALLPKKAYANDAGLDLFSVEDCVIPAKGTNNVNIGLKLAFLDEGYWFKIESRSGLAFKHDITAFQGVIDNPYRGNIGVKLFNFSDQDYQVKCGDRIAQIVIYYENNDFSIEWGKASNTVRGNSGFGSSGK
jgi:dUTP pyrophosphatase